MYDGNVRNRIRMANVLIRCVIFNLYVLWCRRTDDVVNKMRMANTTTIDFCVLEFPAKPSSANSIEFRQPKKRKKKKQRIKNRISCFFFQIFVFALVVAVPSVRMAWHISLYLSCPLGRIQFLTESRMRSILAIRVCFELVMHKSLFFLIFFLCVHTMISKCDTA